MGSEEVGIRTYVTIAGESVFETDAIGHSATLPRVLSCLDFVGLLDFVQFYTLTLLPCRGTC